MSQAAISAKQDFLDGLKENVIVGKKIPAGTGLRRYDKIRVMSQEAYDAQQARRAHFEEVEGMD